MCFFYPSVARPHTNGKISLLTRQRWRAVTLVAVAGHPDMEASFSIFHVLQFYGIFHIKMPLFKSQIFCLLSFMHAVHTKLGCLPFDMRKGLYKLHKYKEFVRFRIAVVRIGNDQQPDATLQDRFSTRSFFCDLLAITSSNQIA